MSGKREEQRGAPPQTETETPRGQVCTWETGGGGVHHGPAGNPPRRRGVSCPEHPGCVLQARTLPLLDQHRGASGLARAEPVRPTVDAHGHVLTLHPLKWGVRGPSRRPLSPTEEVVVVEAAAGEASPAAERRPRGPRRGRRGAGAGLSSRGRQGRVRARLARLPCGRASW